MKTFFKIVLLLLCPPAGLVWIATEWLFESTDKEMEEQAKRDELLKRATIALEKQQAEEVPFWRANK